MIVNLKKVGRTYPLAIPVRALHDINLQIMEGEFIALMGRSGSGKSTLLHQIGLLDEPTAGKITLDGQNTATLSTHEKSHFRLEKLGYIFQEFALMTELNALENVCLPLMAKHKRQKNDIEERAISILKRLGLGDRLDHFPNELSGGEQQRVSIARALVNQPRIILADEPTASLDSESAQNILELLTELNRDFKQTIIMISHEPEDRKWVNRTIWLRDGMIEKIN